MHIAIALTLQCMWNLQVVRHIWQKHGVMEQLDNVLKDAKASQRKENSLSTTLRSHGKEQSSVRKMQIATAAYVDAWLHALKHG